MDTDSLLLAICGDELIDIVKPDKKYAWESVIKPQWFADNSARSQKTPGRYLNKQIQHLNVCLYFI